MKKNVEPYTTVARNTSRDLRNLIVEFKSGERIFALNMEEFESKWAEAGYPPDIKKTTSNGFDATLYPTVLALGPIASAVLSAKAGGPIMKGEGMTCQNTTQAKELLRELTKTHEARGSKLYAPMDRLKAFTWTGRVYEQDRMKS